MLTTNQVPFIAQVSVILYARVEQDKKIRGGQIIN